MTVATNMLCLISRTDYDHISEQRRVELQPFYDAFQDAATSARLISNGNQTTIEIMVANILVEEVNKLLWYGIHDLVSPGNIAYVELHNFDEKGNILDIEKLVIEDIVMSIVKHSDVKAPQSIQITGVVATELTIADPLPEEDTKDAEEDAKEK